MKWSSYLALLLVMPLYAKNQGIYYEINNDTDSQLTFLQQEVWNGVSLGYKEVEIGALQGQSMVFSPSKDDYKVQITISNIRIGGTLCLGDSQYQADKSGKLILNAKGNKKACKVVKS
jgi:hypothetical protein